jgi:hypothetical protein
MLRCRRRASSRGRAALCWAVALFAGVQFALHAYLTRLRPELRDPEYGSLLTALRARLVESPGRPLVLVLGSSRTANVVRPAPPGSPTDPVVFNFATLASGPLRELQMLRRLLASGVRPRWVVAEVWPPFLTQRPGFDEEKYLLDRDLQWSDWPLVSHCFADPWPAYRKLAVGELVPSSGHRAPLLKQWAPLLEPPEHHVLGDWADPALRIEGYGWLAAPTPRPGPELFPLVLERGRENTRRVLDDFQISPAADRALRDLLQTCKDHQIRLALLLVPEHSSLRACTPPQVQTQVEAYLRDSCGEDVPRIDTRDWADDDDFLDMTHVLPRAAGPYTERLSREVLRPLLDGRPYSPSTSPPYPTAQTGPAH